MNSIKDNYISYLIVFETIDESICKSSFPDSHDTSFELALFFLIRKLLP